MYRRTHQPIPPLLRGSGNAWLGLLCLCPSIYSFPKPPVRSTVRIRIRDCPCTDRFPLREYARIGWRFMGPSRLIGKPAATTLRIRNVSGRNFRQSHFFSSAFPLRNGMPRILRNSRNEIGCHKLIFRNRSLMPLPVRFFFRALSRFEN